MNATTEPPDAMSKPLNAATMSAILSKCRFVAEGKVRVACTLHTEHLLRKAGVRDPKVLEEYDVSVIRDAKGFLVLDHESKAPVLENSDDSLFGAGGIFAGEQAPVDSGAIHEEIQRNRAARVAPDAVAEFDALCEISRTRTFEIPNGPHEKFRVQVIAFEDESLPSPSEREQWKPKKATNVQIHAAIAALHMARDLSHFEKL